MLGGNVKRALSSRHYARLRRVDIIAGAAGLIRFYALRLVAWNARFGKFFAIQPN
jgi:hypothetical protein